MNLEKSGGIGLMKRGKIKSFLLTPKNIWCFFKQAFGEAAIDFDINTEDNILRSVISIISVVYKI